MTSPIPESALELNEMEPAEDLLLTVLREALPDVRIQSLLEDNQLFPAVIVRSEGSFGTWNGDERGLDTAQVQIDVLVDGINSDGQGARLSESVRVALRNGRNKVTPFGWMTRVRMTSRPQRVPDWATSVGPVQYADLPTGVSRYETSYNITIRRPRLKPFPAP